MSRLQNLQSLFEEFSVVIGEFASDYSGDEYVNIFGRWNSIKDAFGDLFQLTEEHILGLPNGFDNLIGVGSGLKFLKAQTELENYEDFFGALNNISNSLSGIVPSVPHEFKALRYAPDAAKKALRSFVQVGKDIRRDESFDRSTFKKLESFLVDRNANVSEIFGRDEAATAHYSFDRSFLALAAPSMEGKTQFAFVCRDIKPLYFPMSDSQPIYSNFKALASTLRECSRKDFEFLGSKVPTASDLRDEFHNRKFYTLGFWKKLAENVNHPADLTWLEHLSTLSDFYFVPVALSSLEDDLSGFAVFIDEFSGTDENRLIRNIARAAGIPVILANTNTKVANLVDRAGASGSGSAAGPSVWSLVLNKLDPISQTALNSRAEGERFNFSEAIAEIISWFPAPSNRVRRFLLALERDMMKDLRPGVAAYLAEIIKSFASEQPCGARFTLGTFLDYVLARLAEKLRLRKNKLTSSFVASLGQIALFLPESFADYPGEEEGNLNESWRNPRFLEEHLFYLKNPVDNSNRFLTFPGAGGQDNLQLRGNVPWEREYTLFRPEEFLCLLGCWYMPFFRTVATIFAYADRDSSRASTSTIDSVNPNAVFLDGNRLEVQAAVALGRSSHFHYPASRNHGPVFSCKGQIGTNFFKNLVFQLMDTDLVFQDLSFTIPSSLSAFLNRLRIPFLYGLNRADRFLDHFASRISNELYARCYERTTDALQIDGKFLAKLAGVSDEVVITCECKNRKERINATLLLESLDGFLLNYATLGIVICREAVQRPTSTSQFAELCALRGIAVFRVDARMIRRRGRLDLTPSFKFVPFIGGARYNSRGTRLEKVLIILETELINNPRR